MASSPLNVEEKWLSAVDARGPLTFIKPSHKPGGGAEKGAFHGS